jgi:hypothetical protein
MIKKKHIIRGFLIGLALTGAVLLLHSAVLSTDNDVTSCEQSAKAKKQKTNGKMIWESLSQQFVPSI